jgi:hypothetical protein
MSMVTRRGIHLADGGLERLRRRVIDVIDVDRNARAGCSRGATATATATTDHCHHIVLYRDNLRHGDDDHDRRGG